MPEPTTATRQATWSRTFPATAPHVAEARRSLALLLNGCPAASDAILCLSEIVTNAIFTAARHSQAATSPSTSPAHPPSCGCKSKTTAAPGHAARPAKITAMA